jgi:hypothetical protein
MGTNFEGKKEVVGTYYYGSILEAPIKINLTVKRYRKSGSRFES